MRKNEGEETSWEIFSAKNANILCPNLLLSMFPVNGKKRRRKYISYGYTLRYNAGNSYSHEMCAKYDISIMGMINETSQNDQKKKVSEI